MDNAATNPVIRRALLEILEDAANRDRSRGDDPSTYIAEALLQSTLSLRGFPMATERMRAQLFYLRDKSFVKFHETKVGGQRFFQWRIEAHGTDVLEGAVADPGIAGA